MNTERPALEKEAVARQMNASREPTPERAEKALPELKLTELQKSEAPINKVENQQLKIETIRPWNNYTIATLEGSDKILVFDEDARPIKDFKPPSDSKKI